MNVITVPVRFILTNLDALLDKGCPIIQSQVQTTAYKNTFNLMKQKIASFAFWKVH